MEVSVGPSPSATVVSIPFVEAGAGRRAGSGGRSGPLPSLLPRVADPPTSPRAGVDNMDDLTYLHSAAVLANVHARFRADAIYTYTGPILIAVNPFKPLALYGDETVQRYHIEGEIQAQEGPGPRDAVATLPPHAFATAVRPGPLVLARACVPSVMTCALC